MNLHDRTVQTDRFDLDADELLALQLSEESIEHSGFGPAVHARVDRMPVAKALGQGAPLTAVLCDKQNRINHVEVLMRDIPPLSRQMWRDARVLVGCDFHPRSISRSVNTP